MFKPYSSSLKVTKHSLCCKIRRITFLPASGSMRKSPWPRFQGLAHSIGWLRRRRSLTWTALRVTLWPHCPSWRSPLICTLGYIRERTWGDLRGSHTHSGLGTSCCFCDPDHMNLSLLHRNEENVVEVYSQFTVYFFGFHLWIPHHTEYSNFYAEKNWYEHIRKNSRNLVKRRKHF